VKRSTLVLSSAVLVAVLAPAHADEGMWTFNNFPADKVENAYGFRPNQKWLDHVRLSSIRLAEGCSASFVSPRGLVQTNHHCARDCVEQLSTADNDMVASGFYAREQTDEVKCPTVEANQLVDIIPVTDRISNATSGKDGAEFAAALKAERASIEQECAGQDDSIRCDVVELYNGGVYDLYKYRRYQDVRLVFAPEESIAFFGGDPDNFEFPRYDFDVSYLRVYADDKPLDTSPNYFRYAAADARPGDVVFISGNPGWTYRLNTVAELAMLRDAWIPTRIFLLAETRGQLTRFSAEGPEQARSAKTLLYDVENSLKAYKGALAALVDPTIIRDRAVAEQALRAKVDADPTLRAQYGAAWDNIKDAQERYRPQVNRSILLIGGEGYQSALLEYAQHLVRHADEATKPDSERLNEYTDAAFPETRQRVLSSAPIYPDLEKLRLTFSLTKLRELLGPDDDFVKKVLGKKSPEALAGELIDGTGLASLELRQRLLDANAATIAASTDPMIRFARAIDPDLRTVRKAREDGYDAALTKYSGQIARARFAIEGASSYPDATFSPRLSYGSVAGYSAGGRQIGPFTYVKGLYERATGSRPFALPPRWIAAQAALNPQQPFDLVTTNDAVGGNSGSPLINKDGQIVGLMFDGNIESLGGDYGYDGTVNRAVFVSVGILREGLAKVYHADRLVAELAQ
jgi:peptidase S46-like protein